MRQDRSQLVNTIGLVAFEVGQTTVHSHAGEFSEDTDRDTPTMLDVSRGEELRSSSSVTDRCSFIPLDANDDLCRQYALAQHMASSLSSNTIDEQLDAETQKAIIAATRLWQQTRQMKATILDKCRLYLKSTDANVQVREVLM